MKFDIEQYVNDNLSRVKPVQSDSGNELTATCPSCDRYGGFYVNCETGAYLCNKCEFRARTIVGLVAHVEDITWADARGYIFKKSVKLRRKADLMTLLDRIKALRPEEDEDDEDETSLVEVETPRYYVPIFDEKRDPQWKIPKYLKAGERAIKTKVAKAWGLGYVRKRDQREGAQNLCDRLIIPINCPSGVSWTARAMSDDVWGPKYLNPSGADHRRLLIGWHVARLTGDVVICEGPLDAVRLYQHGVTALALGGKELHDEQLAQLMDLPKSSAVTIMLDPEETISPYDIAARLHVHFDWIYIASLPQILTKSGEKLDPGNATRRQVHRALDEAKRWKGSRSARLGHIVSRARIKAQERFAK